MKPVNPIKNNSKNVISKSKNSSIDTFMFYIIYFMLAIIPIALFFHQTKFVSPLIVKGSYNSHISSNMFSYLNFVFLLIGTILLVLGMVYKIVIEKYEIIETKYNFIVLSNAFFISLATAFSSYKKVALFGLYDSFESAITAFCYLVLFLILINLKISQKRRTILIFSLVPFILINLVLGLLSFFGVNILHQEWFLTLTGHPKGWSFPVGVFMTSTLTNPNYISGAAGSLFVLFFSMSQFSKERGVKIAAGICAFASTVISLVALSSSGNILIIVFFPVIVGLSLLMRKKEIRENLIISVVILLASSLVFISFARHNPHVWNESIGFFIHKNPFAIVVAKGADNAPKDSNSEGQFVKFKSESLEYYQKKGIIPKLPEPGISMLNGRGYIWEKTIDAWKKRPITGYGLSTVAFVVDTDDTDSIAKFSQQDFIIGVSHNLYLDWLFGTGILGLLSFLMLLFAVILDFIKRLFRKEENSIIIAIGLYVIAYLVQGVVNSSRIQTSVMFWLLLGLLVNAILASKSKEITK